MTWIVIAVVLLIAFGPILWMLPTKRDKRLSALRTRARAEGMTVEMRHVPKPDPTPEERVSAGGRKREPYIECAAYGIGFGRKLRHLPAWRIVRVSSGDGADPFPGWRYDRRPAGENRAHLEAMLALTRPFLERLPTGVVAVEVDPRMTLVYWREPPGSDVETVSAMADGVREFESGLGALDAGIEQRLADHDS
jgi:hypothetical protein